MSILRGETSAPEAARTQGLTLAEIELGRMAGWEFLLKEALADLLRYDYILLDCPPNLGLLTLNAFTAAQEVYIPLQTEFLALQGVSNLLETVNVVKKSLNPGLAITRRLESTSRTSFSRP